MRNLYMVSIDIVSILATHTYLKLSDEPSYLTRRAIMMKRAYSDGIECTYDLIPDSPTSF